MFLILGLGNPGPKYELTRHNVGFMAVDNFSDKHGIALETRGPKCYFGRGEHSGIPIVVAKPVTYMNESGVAAKALASELGISPEQIIVVHDDIDLALGKIRVRHKGRDAGQKGVRSIIQKFCTEEFSRVRVGVGRPEDIENVVDHVLSPFEKNEWPEVNEIIKKTVSIIETVLVELNQKRNQPEESNE